MTVPSAVEKYAPTLVFSEGERYLPCSLFFAGKNIVNNKQEYEELADDQKLNGLFCYYHVTEGRRYTVYQYWYYYAYNEYTLDNHEHDFECFKVFVDREGGQPKIITCNIHVFREITPINGEVPKIKVERGGHGLFTENKHWHWSRGLELRVKPTESCEVLRESMMPSASILMDKELKLIGNDYDWVGKLAAPQVPWARWEYYLPEETLYGLDREPEVDLSGIPGVDRLVPYMELVETMRSKPEGLREQRNVIVQRTREQVAFRSAYSTDSRKRIIQALSDSKVKVPEGLKQPLMKRTGSILLPDKARDLQEALTLGRRYGVVTKRQYSDLRYAGVQLREERELKPLSWKNQSRKRRRFK